MKKILAIVCLTILSLAFSIAALAANKSGGVPAAPPKVKPGNRAPHVPNTRVSDSNYTSQGSSQGTSQSGGSKSGSNFGQKAENKENPPRK